MPQHAVCPALSFNGETSYSNYLPLVVHICYCKYLIALIFFKFTSYIEKCHNSQIFTLQSNMIHFIRINSRSIGSFSKVKVHSLRLKDGSYFTGKSITALTVTCVVWERDWALTISIA